MRARSYTTNFELAQSLLSRGQPQRALEAARRAQALEPAHGSVVDLIQEIEVALRRMQSQSTVKHQARMKPAGFDAARWVDEARMALTAGERSEAVRIVEDVLAVEPEFEPARELKELLHKPARPGRTRTGSLRPQTYRHAARLQTTMGLKPAVTFGEPPGIQVVSKGPRPGLIAAGGVDGSIRLWDLENRSKVASFRTELHQRAGHEALVTSLAFSPDGAFLASGHVDGNIRLWSLDTGEQVSARIRHDASIGELAFSPDGETLASGGLDSTLKLWNMEQMKRGQAERRLIRQPAGVTAVAYTGEGALLITGHTNRVLRVYDARTGRLTATLRGHDAAISRVALSPDGNQLATGGRDCTIRIFDLNRREQLKVLSGHKKAIAGISYFPDGNELASVAMDHSLMLWDVAGGRLRTTLWGTAGEDFASVVVTPEEPLIVAGLADGRLRVWTAD